MTFHALRFLQAYAFVINMYTKFTTMAFMRFVHVLIHKTIIAFANIWFDALCI